MKKLSRFLLALSPMPVHHLMAGAVAFLCVPGALRTEAELIIGTGSRVGYTPWDLGNLTEISGLVVSRSLPGTLWVHEDSGNPAVFYGFTPALLSSISSRITLSDAPNTDWEDMATGPKPGGGNYLYIGDIGDNGASRSNVKIIRVPEPVTSGNKTITSADYRVKQVIYPGGPRNAESLFCDPLTSDLYIISKQGTARIYRLPADQFEASGTFELEYLGNLNAPLPDPTSADISPDGGYILVRNSTSGGVTAYLFERGPGTTVGQALTATTPRAVTLQSEGQGEAIGWTTNSSGFYSIGEGSVVSIWYYSVTQTTPPFITAQPQSGTNCLGTTATFTVTATNGPLFYRWRKGTQDLANGGNVSGATTATLTLTSVSPADAANYSVVVTNMAGTAPSTAATLTVVPPPTASVNSATICLGGSATLTTSSDARGPGYLWSPGGATTASITVSPTSTTTYTVTLTDGTTGCVNSGSGTVTVNPLPTVSVNSETICAGGSATLTATSDASSPGYLWSPGGATTASITVSPSATTTYTVAVTDGTTGCANSGSGTVTLNPLPTASAGDDLTVCSGSPVPIGGSPTAGGGTAPYTYSWMPTTGLSDATAANPTATITSATTYTVTVTDANGCTASDSVALTLAPEPEITSITLAGPDVTLVWSSLAGQTYRVQYKTDLNDSNPAGWTDVTGDVLATGETATKTDSVGAATQRFYRISMVCP
jgi:hypothetical protein